jgi:hypothetical protein
MNYGKKDKPMARPAMQITKISSAGDYIVYVKD